MGSSSFIVFVVYSILLVSRIVLSCRQLGPNGDPETAVLLKKSPSNVPICIILNDQFLFGAQVQFDVFSRVVIQGSFSAVTETNACANQPMWFPKGCNWNDGSYGQGIGAGAPTNYYVSVQGISSSYKKRYAHISASTTDKNVGAVFPIVTLVINVKNGIVNDVYWDDNCYFNYVRTSGSETGATQMSCEFNGYDMGNLYSNLRNGTFRSFLNPSGKGTLSLTGYDTFIRTADCKTNTWKDPAAPTTTPTTPPPTQAPASTPSTSTAPTGPVPFGGALPTGFCDLGFYITWTGTSADGQQLGSAGKRFRRFREYAMAAQYPTMINFNGHFVPSTTT